MTTPTAVITPAAIWKVVKRSLNRRRPAMAAMGISITPTALTGPTGDRAMAVNHRPEAAAPQNPAPSDWRQAAITAFSESGLRLKQLIKIIQ